MHAADEEGEDAVAGDDDGPRRKAHGAGTIQTISSNSVATAEQGKPWGFMAAAAKGFEGGNGEP